MPSSCRAVPGGAEWSETAPTVIAPAATPGALIVPGPSPLLPAATTTTSPPATAASTALLTASDPSVPSLPSERESTSTPGCSWHHWTEAATLLSDPEPELFSTFAAYRSAAGATPPNVAADVPPTPSPAAMAATWVPCPWSS